MPKINAATINEHKEQTRTALLDAGAAAFVRSGLAETSIGTLADDAGIARTTVYEYFPNKEAVLAALIEERVPPVVERAISDLPEVGPAERLSEILRRGFQLVAEFPVEAMLMFRVSRELPKPERDQSWSVFDVIREEMMSLCAAGIARGVFAAMDPTTLGTIVADHFVGGIDELAARTDEDAEDIIETRISFLYHGLGPAD
ncbi:MAG: TetR/AcrR family transcriptional regulator [bacterium]|nr:TetR/AcrR family transcriptional regulator [bacterium]